MASLTPLSNYLFSLSRRFTLLPLKNSLGAVVQSPQYIGLCTPCCIGLLNHIVLKRVLHIPQMQIIIIIHCIYRALFKNSRMLFRFKTTPNTSIQNQSNRTNTVESAVESKNTWLKSNVNNVLCINLERLQVESSEVRVCF